MDTNGTRFHLLYGARDWTATLAESARHGPVDAVWDAPRNALTLEPRLNVFIPRGRRPVPLQPEARRAAAVDRFGNLYWIGVDRRTLYWLPSGSGRPAVYWRPQATQAVKRRGAFAPVPALPQTPPELAGMTITIHHYLVVGNVRDRGLFVFDLHAGGEPLLLLLPPGIDFTPFDMAAAPDGGLWILDRDHSTYWAMDRHFQFAQDPESASPLEAPEGESTVATPFLTRRGEEPHAGARPPDCGPPRGFTVAATDPISIEALPDGSVLILDGQGAGPGGGSALLHYRFGAAVAPPRPLPDLSDVAAGGEAAPLGGHDLVYRVSEQLLYVVARDGNQAFAFRFDPLSEDAALHELQPQAIYLPMQAFGSRALIAGGEEIFYDAALGDPGDGSRPLGADLVVRWATLQTVAQPRYAKQAILHTQVFDGKERGCVWHRLFLDACIPAETGVTVESRAAEDPDLLAATPFQAEPGLYLRSRGSELPYHRPFADLDHPRAGTGTWELLFQAARGRYLQLRLTLTGNGRATPQLRSLRAYYPRFSYPKRYLPAVYEDADETHFLERLLANVEGIFTEIEGRMVQVPVLFDARSAPAETLEWLASWMGLVVDPLWAKLPAHGALGCGDVPRVDRRRLLIRFARKLYEQRGTPAGIRFALHLLLDPCLEQVLDRFRAAAVQENPSLRAELGSLGLTYPTPAMSDAEYEALLYDYLLAPARPSKIRLVERYQTRQGRAVVAGDPSKAASVGPAPTIAGAAHRFSVLLPEGLAPEEEAMVQHIVALEKPAHTLFDVRRYWDYFRVGEVRVGLDTVLGEVPGFGPMILGHHYLADGYLAPDHPFDVHERLIAGRDPLGRAPI